MFRRLLGYLDKLFDFEARVSTRHFLYRLRNYCPPGPLIDTSPGQTL
jgi:hypothetical protein